MNWGGILSLFLGFMAGAVAFGYGMHRRWYEVETGRIGNQPVIKYQYGLLILLALCACYITGAGCMHLLELFGIEAYPPGYR
jgi:hypothetical protein